MKTTSIVRKIDSLGRIVIPIGIRRKLMINNDDPIEMFIRDDEIILKPYNSQCVICGGAFNIEVYRNKKICNDCIKGLNNAK